MKDLKTEIWKWVGLLVSASLIAFVILYFFPTTPVWLMIILGFLYGWNWDVIWNFIFKKK